MAAEDINIGEKLTSFPIGELIYTVAMGIAKAQWELNKASMVTAELMSGSRVLRDLDGTVKLKSDGTVQRDDTRVYFGYDYTYDDKTDTVRRDPRRVSLLELGFTPTFYQFVDTIIEVKITLKIHKETKTGRTSTDKTNQTGSVAVASTVDANYAQTYNYSAEGSSLVRTKIVPIPPPAILEERIRVVMNAEQQIQKRFQDQHELYVEQRKALLAREAELTKKGAPTEASELPKYQKDMKDLAADKDANGKKILQLQAGAAKENITLTRPDDVALTKAATGAS